MAWEELLLRQGDRAEGLGRLFRDQDGEWFEPPVPAPAVGGPRTVSGHSQLSVPVVRADLHAVSHLFRDREGGVEGWATVRGRWLSGVLHVEAQRAGPPSDEPSLMRIGEVAPRNCTRAQVDAALQDLDDHREEWTLYRWGEDTRDDGQVVIVAQLSILARSMTVWGDTLPPGLVEIQPWLVPVGTEAV